MISDICYVRQLHIIYSGKIVSVGLMYLYSQVYKIL